MYSLFKKYYYLLLLICVNSFIAIFANKRIVNGIDASENEFKFVVSLQRNGAHFCGGTVLDERHVLTAAHCVCNVNWDVQDLLKVKVTPLELNSSNAATISIQSVVCNDYDLLELIKDVAVINLVQEIPNTQYEPVKLADSNFSTALPLHGVLVGWGLTSTAGTVSNVLQKVDVVVYNDAICKRSYFGTRNIEHQICSGWPQNGRGSCQGDSGGPLLVGNVQIGVISFGDNSDCAISDMAKPKISARVSTYLEWINDVLNSDTILPDEEQTTEENTSSTVVETTVTDLDKDGEGNGTDVERETTTEEVQGNPNRSRETKSICFNLIWYCSLCSIFYSKTVGFFVRLNKICI